ncbi:MAG: ImmA/IrrE family metallo-endopeptidase [Betaproteobacteria bacterium]|nr:ImmA/IrrE family metallo-endopeptidase [Betaproteobacteria bacterium]
MYDLTNTPNPHTTQGAAGISAPNPTEAHHPAGVGSEQQKPPFLAMLREALTEPGRISKAYTLFHAYSFGNALWIAEQLDARGEPLAPIASFNRWKELGRVVKKGSKALCMSMPVTVKAKVDTKQAEGADPGTEDDSGRRVLFMVRRNWFALHHTEPLDGSEPQAIETTTPDWNAQRALASLDITREDFQHTNGNVQGYVKPNTRCVAVSPLAVNPAKTLFHEIAHCLLHSDQARIEDGAELGRDRCEVEAESVAYLCCAVLGLPGLEESRGYVQDWLAGSGCDAESFTDKHARRVLGAVDKILKAGRQVEEAGA